MQFNRTVLLRPGVATLTDLRVSTSAKGNARAYCNSHRHDVEDFHFACEHWYLEAMTGNVRLVAIPPAAWGRLDHGATRAFVYDPPPSPAAPRVRAPWSTTARSVRVLTKMPTARCLPTFSSSAMPTAQNRSNRQALNLHRTTSGKSTA